MTNVPDTIENALRRLYGPRKDDSDKIELLNAMLGMDSTNLGQLEYEYIQLMGLDHLLPYGE